MWFVENIYSWNRNPVSFCEFSCGDFGPFFPFFSSLSSVAKHINVFIIIYPETSIMTIYLSLAHSRVFAS